MDILDELTDLSGAPPHEVKAVADRAIKEIELLRKERDRLREALEGGDVHEIWKNVRDIAKAALKETE